jgi:hypothetical protein
MDRYRLLCEACGYPLEDLPADARCPECGKPIAESHPDHRPGSPWQRKRSVRSWFDTSAMALRRPGKLFDSIAITRQHGTSLLVLNAILAGFFVASPWVGTLIGDPVRRMERGSALSMLAFLGVLIGLLIFESRVFLGVRRCRFAATKREPASATETLAARI